jgi:DNA-binding transcriptional MerR regulator
MSRFIKIGEATKIPGVSIQTLRLCEETGCLVPDRKSEGRTRYYNFDRLIGKKVS